LGLTTIGCYSKTLQICTENTGNFSLHVLSISLSGCGSEFMTKNLPTFPHTLTPGGFVCADVTYLPQNEGVDDCALVINTDDNCSSTTNVELYGEGTWETENTQYFTVTGNAPVEIQLDSTADSSSGSIRIWVDRGDGYQEVKDCWQYNAPSNSITFNYDGGQSLCNPGAYTLQSGDKIKIWYKMVCFLE
jgi:hypothetical protein